MVEDKEPAGPKKMCFCRAMVLMVCQRFLSVFSSDATAQIVYCHCW